MVLGLLTLTAGWTWAAVVSRDASALTARTLDTRAAAVEEAAQAEARRYSDSLVLVAAALGAVSEVDAAAFESAAAPLDSMDLAGATSLVFMAPPVRDGGLDELEAAWTARGSTALELDPVEAEETHVFAVLSKPLDGSGRRRTGLDVAGAPAPYEALMESRRSGEVAISHAYQLIIDQELPESERQTSFSVTAPVVNQGRFVGWVLMGVRGQDFLGEVLERAAEGRVDVNLVADDIAGTDLSVATVSYSGGGAGAAEDQSRRSILLPVAQHTWTLEVAADEQALIGAIRHRPLAIQVIAVVVALLVAGLWWTLRSSRVRAQAEIRAATRDLALAEEAARRHAAMLDAMVEAIDEVGVSVIDADGRFLVHSRTARQILGVEVESDPSPGGAGDTGVAGSRRWQEHYGMFTLDGSPFAESDMPLVRALAGEATDAVEMVIRNHAVPHGVQIAVSGRPIALGSERTGALAVFRDVTEDRRREAEQSAFTGMVAHDLKNPLALVRGCLELVDDDLQHLAGPADLVDTVITYLGKASAAADRMAGLIDDLLAYATASDTDLDVTPVELGTLVRDTLADVVAGHLAERRAAGIDLPPPLVHVGELPVVECDEERMRQVLANLVGNALKYVKPDARAVIDVTAEAHGDGDGVRIFVADRGIGIPAHLRADVLKPFVRTPTTAVDPRNYPGTGLGLAICRRIVERHGGSLLLEPNPGGGTIAVVDLPGVASPPSPPGPRASPRPFEPAVRTCVEGVPCDATSTSGSSTASCRDCSVTHGS